MSEALTYQGRIGSTIKFPLNIRPANVRGSIPYGPPTETHPSDILKRSNLNQDLSSMSPIYDPYELPINVESTIPPVSARSTSTPEHAVIKDPPLDPSLSSEAFDPVTMFCHEFNSESPPVSSSQPPEPYKKQEESTVIKRTEACSPDLTHAACESKSIGLTKT